MPRYRLEQTAEAAGRDTMGRHATPVVYWECILYASDADALAAAKMAMAAALDRRVYPCREGWEDGRIDLYDASAAIQRDRPSDTTHIATLTRLD